jgi:hypothetical protein
VRAVQGEFHGACDKLFQAFTPGTSWGQTLKADIPFACTTEAGALRTAERLALSKLGVVAFSSTGDPERGDYDGGPAVFFRQGQIPSDFDDPDHGSTSEGAKK